MVFHFEVKIDLCSVINTAYVQLSVRPLLLSTECDCHNLLTVMVRCIDTCGYDE